MRFAGLDEAQSGIKIAERNTATVCMCVHAKLLQSCVTLCDPVDCRLPPDSSVYGIFQARVLEWGAIAFSAEYIMRNAGLEETQAAIKIAGRNINNLSMQVTPPFWQKVKRN